MAGIRKKTWQTSKGKKTCWEITYYVNGKLCRKSGFKTRLEAQEAMPVITKTFSKNILLLELATNYIENHCKLRCKESTIKLYQSYLNTHLAPFHKTKARVLKSYQIESQIILWKESGMSNKTINDIRNFGRSIYNYGIKNKWISENPFKEVEALKKEQKKIQFLSDKERNDFLKYIKEFPLPKQTALLLAIQTGIRISELLAIEWADVDFAKGTLDINKQHYKGKLTDPKTYKSARLIHLPNDVTQILKRFKKERRIFSKLVFCNKEGGYWRQQKFIDSYFKKVMKKIGKPHYSFHCLRHTYATFLLSHGIPLKFVQETLGHSTPQTTLTVYNHVMPSVNDKAMNLLENLDVSNL